MSMDIVVDLGRKTMESTIIVVAPLLATAIAVSLIINFLQVATSMQDSTISTVPKLLVTGAAGILLMPWMLRRLAAFTLALLSDFRPYIN